MASYGAQEKIPSTVYVTFFDNLTIQSFDGKFFN